MASRPSRGASHSSSSSPLAATSSSTPADRGMIHASPVGDVPTITSAWDGGKFLNPPVEILLCSETIFTVVVRHTKVEDRGGMEGDRGLPPKLNSIVGLCVTDWSSDWDDDRLNARLIQTRKYWSTRFHSFIHSIHFLSLSFFFLFDWIQ